MKKFIISITLIGCMGFFALQQAHAGRGRNSAPSPDCPAWNGGYSQFQNSADPKKVEAFLSATVDLRKNLVMKQAEYQAMMNGTNPDPAKASEITGEIFQLRDQIRTKANEAGLSPGYGRAGYPCGGWGGGYGFGPGGGRGGGYGFGPGGGRGYCRGFIN